MTKNSTPILNKKFYQQLLQFLEISGRLKTTFRSTLLTGDRKESVADHSWRMALLVLLVSPFLSQSINLEKTLKMALIHDLGEALIGDVNIIHLLKNPDMNKQKIEQEHQAVMNLQSLLPRELGEELLNLWLEFEANTTYEAKTVHALDKLEVQLQQNESKLTTWKDLEKLGKLAHLESLCDFDPFIKELKTEIKLRRVL